MSVLVNVFDVVIASSAVAAVFSLEEVVVEAAVVVVVEGVVVAVVGSLMVVVVGWVEM
jgi:hypothetical protein